MQNKKENYKSPEIEVIDINSKDIITTSGGLINSGSGSGDGGNFGDWGV